MVQNLSIDRSVYSTMIVNLRMYIIGNWQFYINDALIVNWNISAKLVNWLISVENLMFRLCDPVVRCVLNCLIYSGFIRVREKSGNFEVGFLWEPYCFLNTEVHLHIDSPNLTCVVLTSLCGLSMQHVRLCITWGHAAPCSLHVHHNVLLRLNALMGAPPICMEHPMYF